MAPAELLKLCIDVKGDNLKALIDSGASQSLIRRNYAGDYNESGSSGKMFGLGKKKLEIIGDSVIDFKFMGYDFQLKCLVVDSESINYDLVLGNDFLTSYGMTVHMNQRKVAFTKED